MKGRHFLGAEAAVLVGISRIKGRHALGTHALMLRLELGTADMTVAIGIQRLEAPLVETLGCRAGMIGTMTVAGAMLTVVAVLSVMACRRRWGRGGWRGRRRRLGRNGGRSRRRIGRRSALGMSPGRPGEGRRQEQGEHDRGSLEGAGM